MKTGLNIESPLMELERAKLRKQRREYIRNLLIGAGLVLLGFIVGRML